MASRKRVIVVVTGSRAEFGLLVPVMRAIDGRAGLTLRVIAAGQHLSMDTWRDIPAAGFEIDARVKMQRRGDAGRVADASALGRGVTGFAKVFETMNPDAVVVLGDRIEAFAAASAAAVGGWRLAHIHGGDRAEGVADESMRHAISKLAHIHYCATAGSKRRLIRMGENPKSVIQVGSPALDGLAAIEPMSDKALTSLDLDPSRPFLVVLQHPIGESDEREARWMRWTLKAVEAEARRANMGVVIFDPNSDAGSAGIKGAIKDYTSQTDKGRKTNAVKIAHLPRFQYVALLRRAAVLVGNSSGGLIEASAIRTVDGISADGAGVGKTEDSCGRPIAWLPVVNIGPRQSGRERPANVLDSDYGLSAVRRALVKALGAQIRAWDKPLWRRTGG